MNNFNQYVNLICKIRQLIILADLNPTMKDSIYHIARKLNTKAVLLEAKLLGTYNA